MNKPKNTKDRVDSILQEAATSAATQKYYLDAIKQLATEEPTNDAKWEWIMAEMLKADAFNRTELLDIYFELFNEKLDRRIGKNQRAIVDAMSIRRRQLLDAQSERRAAQNGSGDPYPA